MSKKLKRSAVALVLAATMVFSSQGVLTAFAVGGDIETEASVSSALEPILDKEETDVANESGNTDETETPEVTEPCGITEGCTLPNGHPGECQVAPVDPPVENENGEGETQPCDKTEGCTLPNGHEGECVVEENTEDTEDTQEPSEEDVAAVQAVVDLINALPTTDALANYTPTIELKPEDEGYQEAYQAALDAYYSQIKKDVEAARAAYDALTEEQKAAFDATVLAKLTALEELIAMREQADVLPTGNPETAVAKIGEDYYNTLDEAIEAATNGDTIKLLGDATVSKTLDKSITIDGQGFTMSSTNVRYGFRTGTNLTLKNITANFIYDVQVENPSYSSDLGLFYVNGDTNFTFENATINMNGSGATNRLHAIYYDSCAGTISVKKSNLNISEFPEDAIEWGGKENSNLIIENSTYSSIHNRQGITGTWDVTIENSTVRVLQSTASGSNGANFNITNSIVDFSSSASHGLSAGNLTIQNSEVTTNNNGYCGIVVGGKLDISNNSEVTVEGNAFKNDGVGANYAGLRLSSGESTTISTIDASSSLSVNNNKNTGVYVRSGNLTIADGADIEIMNNTVTNEIMDGFGGGIYVGYQDLSTSEVILPADAKIYNNHSKNGGDDIYVAQGTSLTFGKVGSDWKLDGAPDCNHAITGWFDDSKDNRWNVHTGPVHAELYNEFDETTGLATVTGLKALKAAHPYQYDPDAPTEPSEPVDWETSKSKTATNLDKNYESQVTLSLPAAETVPVTDVVFVLDRSSSAGAARQAISSMMDNLLHIVNTSDAVSNIGVVNSWYEADSGIALTALTNESIYSIKNAIMEGNLSGTNIEAGIDAAVAMLDASSTPDENKYMVLVTDGISHAWNGADGEVKTVWGQGTTQDATQVFNGANSYIYFDPSKTSFEDVFNTPANSELLNSPYEIGNVYVNGKITDQYEELIAAAPEYSDKFIHNGEYDKYYSGVEKGVYTAAHAYADAASKYKCINLYWEVSGYPIASEFMEWTNEQGKCYNISDDLSGAFDEVEREITYVVDAGSQVIDVIGGDDDGVNYDYDFDFVDVVSLTVGGEELDFTKDGNTYYFGESRDGIYPFVLTYYPNGLGVATMDIEDETVVAGELFVWEINVPITIDKSVQLTYTVKLANPKTTEGNYGQYDEDGSENYAGLYTNNSAVLFPVDSNGNVGEKEAFDKPTVSYTVGGNDNPGTDSTPDPDRPSRPNRDDDDDWEPLPDAPVKDKPTTEVDVPEETETPTTEQPDKYNPETGDTTTVFAAMALAAVSLGGVVLLGRKKK